MLRVAGLICVLFVFFTRTYSQQLAETIFHPDTLGTIVSFLASDNMRGRYTGSKQSKAAAQYIAAEFKNIGLIPAIGEKDFLISFSKSQASGQRVNGVNVAAMLPGKSKAGEFIIFSSHYDHIGTTSNTPESVPTAITDKRDYIYNGANDNASGTSAVITLAKYYAAVNNNERSLLFICFAGEEQGLLGSKDFASRVNASQIRAVINIEMIGRGMDSAGGNAFITADALTNFRDIVNNSLLQQTNDSSDKRMIFARDRYEGEMLFMRSDNYPFLEKDIPSHTVMLTSPEDPYYHSVKDEVNTLDFESMSLIIKSIVHGCAALVSGAETPRWLQRNK